MKNLFKALVAMCAMSMASGVSATPIQWSSSVGGNDHWYELVFPEQTLSWNEARDAAATSSASYAPSFTSMT